MDDSKEAERSVPSSRSCPESAGSAKFSRYGELSDNTATNIDSSSVVRSTGSAPELPIEGLALFLDRIMTVLPAPRRHCFQAAFEPLPHGPNVNREIPPPTPRTDVREAEEVEGGRLRPALLF